ncbi:hypothetical protein Q7P35_003008 [Cladosporium inversicolor]
MQQTKQPTTHSSRLQTAYLKLTFRHQPETSDQDARREGLFRRLVQHHLLHHTIYTIFDWRDLEAQQTCVYHFLQTYAKQLWPGKRTERAHLANPALQPRNKSSFIGSIDSHWSQRRNGNASRVRAKSKSDDGGSGEKTPVGFECGSDTGGVALSTIGKVLTRYIAVLLEPGLANADVEDTARLIEGIVATEMGPEIMAIGSAEDEVMVKIEDDSD